MRATHLVTDSPLYLPGAEKVAFSEPAYRGQYRAHAARTLIGLILLSYTLDTRTSFLGNH